VPAALLEVEMGTAWVDHQRRTILWHYEWERPSASHCPDVDPERPHPRSWFVSGLEMLEVVLGPSESERTYPRISTQPLPDFTHDFVNLEGLQKARFLLQFRTPFH
jgi:hypothetical protein